MRRVGFVVALSAASLLTGCSAGGDSSRAAAPAAATDPVIVPAPTLPVTYSGGVDAFYRAPTPLPPAPPGTLIRYQPVGQDAHTATWRILYHSVDAAGRDQATPGMITFPKGTAPRAGWPVVANAPGTVGLNTRCALSRTDDRPDAFGVKGVSVRTDYIGMVDGQRQRYLSGVSEAHSVIDAVRAARNIPAAHAGTRYVVFGHSQGGHAALFTNQLARSYAPELDLLGTVAGAPASQFTTLFGPGSEAVPHLAELLEVFGTAADHPGSNPVELLTPVARSRLQMLDNGCLAQLLPTFASLADRGLFVSDPLTTPPYANWLRANEPGRVSSPSPVFLFGGTEDRVVTPTVVDATRARLCRHGQVTRYLLLPGASHGTEIDLGRPQIQAWIADRFAHRPAPNDCPGTHDTAGAER